MSKEVKIPDIGGFEGVEIIDVLVSEGDRIEEEDSLITLESDKAAMDVPAPFAGTVKELKVKTGDKVSEGDVILTVESGDQDGSEEEDEGKEEDQGTERKDDDSGEKGKTKNGKDKEGKEDEGEEDEDQAEEKNGEEEGADKKTRSDKEGQAGEESAEEKEDENASREGERDKKAEREKENEAKGKDKDEAGSEKDKKGKSRARARDRASATPPTVDRISQVTAHAGPSVRKFARELGVNLAAVTGSGRKGRITHEDVKHHVKSALRGGGTALPAIPEVDFSRFGDVERKPLSRIKRISGPRLQAAWVNAPHVTQHDEADITALETVRKAMNDDAGEGGAKITPLAFLVRAVVLAMQAYPDANSALDATGENLIVRRYFHIGFAVDTEGGLVVPVIRDADRKDIREIAAELAALAGKARDGKLKRDEIEGGCFSITSLGSIGGTAFTPIVNAPEAAILGVSRAEMKPRWNGQAFEPRLMLPLSLSYDHRVVDGATAVRFTRHLAETLETLRGFVR